MREEIGTEFEFRFEFEFEFEEEDVVVVAVSEGLLMAEEEAIGGFRGVLVAAVAAVVDFVVAFVAVEVVG